MTNPAPPRDRTPTLPGSQKRQVALPGAAKRQTGARGGLLLLGLALVVASGLGFWYVLQSVDERQEYLMAARTIERWEVVSAGDFVAVEANLGNASGVPVRFSNLVLGRWATGTIPAGTLVTPGMLETPPLSSDEEAGQVLIEVSLPVDEAPQDELEAGDRLALFGVEASAVVGLDGSESGAGDDAALIGVLTVEFVEDNALVYIVTPEEAVAIQDVVDRYTSATDRRIWKLGFDVSVEDLLGLYNAPTTAPAAVDELLPDDGANLVPVQEE